MAELLDTDPQPLVYWDRKQFTHFQDQVSKQRVGEARGQPGRTHSARPALIAKGFSARQSFLSNGRPLGICSAERQTDTN